MTANTASPEHRSNLRRMLITLMTNLRDVIDNAELEGKLTWDRADILRNGISAMAIHLLNCSLAQLDITAEFRKAREIGAAAGLTQVQIDALLG